MDDKKFSHTESEGEAPPTEVIPRAKRRRFSASYKLRILEEADAATASGEVGALLRREGLYSSHLTQWCRQREQGILLGSTQIGKELLAKVEENRKLRQELSKTRSELMGGIRTRKENAPFHGAQEDPTYCGRPMAAFAVPGGHIHTRPMFRATRRLLICFNTQLFMFGDLHDCVQGATFPGAAHMSDDFLPHFAFFGGHELARNVAGRLAFLCEHSTSRIQHAALARHFGKTTVRSHAQKSISCPNGFPHGPPNSGCGQGLFFSSDPAARSVMFLDNVSTGDVGCCYRMRMKLLDLTVAPSGRSTKVRYTYIPDGNPVPLTSMLRSQPASSIRAGTCRTRRPVMSSTSTDTRAAAGRSNTIRV
ncbi:MAG: transposase [Bacteroidota bacterium]|nr:transposase [Bacteroidota bacterium]